MLREVVVLASRNARAADEGANQAPLRARAPRRSARPLTANRKRNGKGVLTPIATG